MQQVNLIGKVIQKPVMFPGDTSKKFYFVVRAENSPPEDEVSYFDFNVVSSNFKIFNKLTIGSEVYVTGLLKMEYCENRTVRTRIKATYISIIDAALTAGTVNIEMIAGSIPLDF